MDGACGFYHSLLITASGHVRGVEDGPWCRKDAGGPTSRCKLCSSGAPLFTLRCLRYVSNNCMGCRQGSKNATTLNIAGAAHVEGGEHQACATNADTWQAHVRDKGSPDMAAPV